MTDSAATLRTNPLARTLSRASSRVFAAALALAIAALAILHRLDRALTELRAWIDPLHDRDGQESVRPGELGFLRLPDTFRRPC